jgi:DNA repair ATPase RecN
VDGGAFYNVDVRVKGQGGLRGKELHELLNDAYGSVESQYKARAAEQLAPQIAQANQQIQQKAAELQAAMTQLANNESLVGQYGASIGAAEGQLQGSVAARQAQWDKLHERYSERAETMDSILSSIDVGGYNG